MRNYLTIAVSCVLGVALGAGAILSYLEYTGRPMFQPGRSLVAASIIRDQDQALCRAEVQFAHTRKDGQHEVTWTLNQLGADGSTQFARACGVLGQVDSFPDAIRLYGTIRCRQQGVYIGSGAFTDLYVGISRPQGGSSGFLGLTLAGQAEPRPGIDHATIQYGGWEGGLAVVVWTDLREDSAGQGGSSGIHGAAYDGYVTAGGKTAVTYEARVVDDGQSGWIKVNDRTLNLADGSLVLVSAAGAEFRLTQLKRATLQMKPTQEVFENLAKTDPEITAFFAEGRSTKQPAPQ